MAKKLTDAQKAKIAEQYKKDASGRVVKVASNVESSEERSSRANKKRVLAVVLWLLAIACEVIGILRFVGVINWFSNIDRVTFIIGAIVLDLLFFVPASLLWKKANHIDPISEKNKTLFWVWNNLGTVLSVLAFVPIIVVVLTDKDLDKKSKTIVTVIAAVALAIAGLTGRDWNPVSKEDLANAQTEIETITGDRNTEVYWSKTGHVYHLDRECQHIKGKTDSEIGGQGTVDKAFEHNHTEACKTCIKDILKQMEDNKETE